MPTEPAPTEPAPTVAVDDPAAHRRAAEALLAGGTVVLPTDTVYGLAARPTSEQAIADIFALKARGEQQPLAVLVADPAQALDLVAEPTEQIRGWMDRFWPGPLTLVVARSSAARELVLGGDPGTIGVRCPEHRFVRALAAEVGPIATTSANRSGEPTPATAPEAAASLTAVVALVVDGGPSPTALASTVVDVTGPVPVLLREGAITAEDLGL